MSLRNKETRKASAMEASESGRQHEYEPDVVGEMYDDTTVFLEKEEDSQVGDIYETFKKNNFFVNAEDQDKLIIFKNIGKHRIHRVSTHTMVFPCVDVIS
jgi:hypothetical protein